MANLTLVNNGIDRMAKFFLNKDTPDTLTVHLYTNNHTPAVTDTTGNYTECLTTFGYSALALTPSSWTGGTSGGIAVYDYPVWTTTFTANSSGLTVYGVYITDAAGGVRLAGLLDVPFVIPPAGGVLNVYLEYQNKQCP